MRREMKLCSIKWFDKIPSEWKVVKVKQLFSIGRGRVIAQTELDDNGLYPVYSSQTKNNGCLGYINTYDFDKKQLTWTTDGANAGTVFLREGKYNCTNVCGTLLPKNKENNLSYLKYILEYTAIFHKRADTNGFKIMNNEMAEIPILLPSKIEQDEIANYLNKKVSKIEDIILKQKILIEKYKAYKQSLITETVINGLNRNVPMKDSGIDWIGEIPSHWETTRIKYLIDFNPSYSENLSDDKSVSFVPMECVGNGYMNFKEAKLESVKGKYTYFSNKDIIMAKVTPCFENGNIAIAKDLLNGVGFGSSELYVFRCNKVDTKFMFYYLRNNTFKDGCISTMTGTGGLKRVSASFIENYIIAIPQIEEQQQIADFLDKKCTAIDSAIAKKEQLIEKLECYKKSLIYECVTGKREVN